MLYSQLKLYYELWRCQFSRITFFCFQLPSNSFYPISVKAHLLYYFVNQETFLSFFFWILGCQVTQVLTGRRIFFYEYMGSGHYSSWYTSGWLLLFLTGTRFPPMNASKRTCISFCPFSFSRSSSLFRSMKELN